MKLVSSSMFILTGFYDVRSPLFFGSIRLINYLKCLFIYFIDFCNKENKKSYSRILIIKVHNKSLEVITVLQIVMGGLGMQYFWGKLHISACLTFC